MFKISAFYLENQKSFVPKKNFWHISNQDFKKSNLLLHVLLLATIRYVLRKKWIKVKL
jgi:hypothetical protein